MNADEEGEEDDADNMGEELDDNESEGDSGWCTQDPPHTTTTAPLPYLSESARVKAFYDTVSKCVRRW